MCFSPISHLFSFPGQRGRDAFQSIEMRFKVPRQTLIDLSNCSMFQIHSPHESVDNNPLHDSVRSRGTISPGLRRKSGIVFVTVQRGTKFNNRTAEKDNNCSPKREKGSAVSHNFICAFVKSYPILVSIATFGFKGNRDNSTVNSDKQTKYYIKMNMLKWSYCRLFQYYIRNYNLNTKKLIQNNFPSVTAPSRNTPSIG